MIEVILVAAAAVVHRDGSPRYFVEIKGIPDGKGVTTQVITSALPHAQAVDVRTQVEDALDAYRRPKRKGGKRKPKTSWERIIRDG